ncbi:protein of unknown function [Methylotuvimicrobium alcaliphilum 20Z]|uniref:Uncharacterized protein n=1 Tax=Methylotuvimicrobium alcaliphilum (strain DSM 19304 / NCIMB 14124 / VKM B-2133 / 20Z) TaxID=1091494 RepID=G4SXX3_META2|nr:protein of unknown function [Methylotuvimicrobium alcaliphilum 20Z]
MANWLEFLSTAQSYTLSSYPHPKFGSLTMKHMKYFKSFMVNAFSRFIVNITK